MRYYFAPMEGVTGYIYRNAHRDFFPGISRYYSPFISPTQTKSLSTKEMDDVQPANNAGVSLIPQVLTRNAEHFLWTAEKLRRMGYAEINLNLGCPSRTVVSKGKGSGFLADPAALDAFLERIFDAGAAPVSVKTRIGVKDASEFGALMAIYRQYPLCEMILHPRLQTDLYKNTPRMDTMRMALAEAPYPVTYNGDLFTPRAFFAFRDAFPDVKAVMLGRGLVANPALVRQIEGGAALTKEELRAFTDRLFADYRARYGDAHTALFRMKELWAYMGALFTDADRDLRSLRKAGTAQEYAQAADRLFAEKAFRAPDALGYAP